MKKYLVPAATFAIGVLLTTAIASGISDRAACQEAIEHADELIGHLHANLGQENTTLDSALSRVRYDKASLECGS